MNTGNVVKTKDGSIVIITSIDTNVTNWMSFDLTECSGSTTNKTKEVTKICNCGVSDCILCKGTGKYKWLEYGMDRAKVLSPSVKDYIKDNKKWI